MCPQHSPETEALASASEHFLSFEALEAAMHAEHAFAPDFVRRVVAQRMQNLSVFAFQAMRQPPPATPSAAAPGDASAASGTATRSAPSRLASPSSGAGREGSARSSRRSLGTWQVHGLDWAIGPRGEVSLIEANAAPGMRHYASLPSLSPAVWTTMFELVALAQSASRTWLERRARPWHFFGWELLFNEALEASSPRTCAHAFMTPSR